MAAEQGALLAIADGDLQIDVRSKRKWKSMGTVSYAWRFDIRLDYFACGAAESEADYQP